MRWSLLVALLVLLSACSILERGADGVWTFEQGTVDGGTISPTLQAPVVLEVASGAVTGNAGCNDYGIEADVYSGAFRLYPDRQITDLGCDPSVMTTESVYWNALQRASRYRVAGNLLQLEGEDVFLTFRRSG